MLHSFFNSLVRSKYLSLFIIIIIIIIITQSLRSSRIWHKVNF